eukprot:EG_transcript_35929
MSHTQNTTQPFQSSLLKASLPFHWSPTPTPNGCLPSATVPFPRGWLCLGLWPSCCLFAVSARVERHPAGWFVGFGSFGNIHSSPKCLVLLKQCLWPETKTTLILHYCSNVFTICINWFLHLIAFFILDWLGRGQQLRSTLCRRTS